MADPEIRTTSTSETSLVTVKTPRPSIFHLMLWTLFSAVYLTLLRLMYSELPEEYAAIQLATGVFHAVIIGAVLTGAIVLGYMRFRFGPPLISEPGHWLILVRAAVSVVQLIPVLVLARLPWMVSAVTQNAIFMFVFGVAFAAQAIAYLFAVRRSRTVRWRVLFGALAVLGLLQCPVYIGNGFGLYRFQTTRFLLSISTRGRFFVCGWAVLASILDVKAGQRRDWLHWTGVATYLASTGGSLVWMIGSWLIRP